MLEILSLVLVVRVIEGLSLVLEAPVPLVQIKEVAYGVVVEVE